MSEMLVVLKVVAEVTRIHNRGGVKTPYDIYKGGLQVGMMDRTNQYS